MLRASCGLSASTSMTIARRAERARDNPRLGSRKRRRCGHLIQGPDEIVDCGRRRRRSRTRRILDKRRKRPNRGEPRNAGNEQPEHKWIQASIRYRVSGLKFRCEVTAVRFQNEEENTHGN